MCSRSYSRQRAGEARRAPKTDTWNFLSSSLESRRGRSKPAGLAFCECPAPRRIRTRVTLLASSENMPGASRVASFPHVLHATTAFSQSPWACIPLLARLSLSPGGLGAETFCPLQRRRWWLEGGLALRPGRWVRAWEPGTSAFGSTRLHLGSSTATARLGKACCKSLSGSRRKLSSVFFADRVVRTLGVQR